MTCNTLYSDGTGISGHSPTPRRESIESLAKHIRLLVLDVDGVMTDGGAGADISFLPAVLDGIGIRLAKTAGIEVAVLSGMDVPCVVRRLEVLGVTEYHGGADNKCTILDGMRKRMSLEWQEIAYLGDDWVDLAPMSRVGLPAAVANAMPDVKKLAKFVTQKEGGCGAVREFVDLLLTCQGKREALLEHWMRLE